MRVIGIRTKPSEVVYAILDSEKNEFINVDKLKLPKALDLPHQLNFIRNNFLDIFREYEIKKAGIRISESNAQKKDLKRIQIESVIQEMFASCELENFYIGQIASISSKIKIPREDFKKYVNNEKSFKVIEHWENHSKEEREALFTALGALHV
jgi:hypothetical protein